MKKFLAVLSLILVVSMIASIPMFGTTEAETEKKMELIHTFNFKSDEKWTPTDYGKETGFYDFIPSEDGTAVTVKSGAKFATETDNKVETFYGAPIDGLTGDNTTVYSIIYKEQAHTAGGDDPYTTNLYNRIGVGALFDDGVNTQLISNYTNYCPGKYPLGSCLHRGIRKFNNYMDWSTNGEADMTDGFRTFKIVYDGPANTITVSLLKKDGDAANDADWYEVEKVVGGTSTATWADNTTPDGIGLGFYLQYGAVDLTIKDVQLYKQVEVAAGDTTTAGETVVPGAKTLGAAADFAVENNLPVYNVPGANVENGLDNVDGVISEADPWYSCGVTVADPTVYCDVSALNVLESDGVLELNPGSVKEGNPMLSNDTYKAQANANKITYYVAQDADYYYVAYKLVSDTPEIDGVEYVTARHNTALAMGFNLGDSTEYLIFRHWTTANYGGSNQYYSGYRSDGWATQAGFTTKGDLSKLAKYANSRYYLEDGGAKLDAGSTPGTATTGDAVTENNAASAWVYTVELAISKAEIKDKYGVAPEGLFIAQASQMYVAPRDGSYTWTWPSAAPVWGGTALTDDQKTALKSVLPEEKATYVDNGYFPTLFVLDENVEVTDAPTTEAPTDAPTTAAPTEAPTTVAPTAAPTTAAPTAAPTTEAPTVAPTTDAPTTAAPTDAPASEAPTTEAPAAEGGCGGSIGLMGLALVATLGTCAVVVTKKKED